MAEENTQAVESPVEEPVANNQEAPAGPDLNISDLAAVKNIIEVATQRGAFKAGELEAVGKVFNKLESFLSAVASQKEE